MGVRAWIDLLERYGVAHRGVVWPRLGPARHLWIAACAGMTICVGGGFEDGGRDELERVQGLCGGFEGWRRATVLDPSASLGMTASARADRAWMEWAGLKPAPTPGVVSWVGGRRGVTRHWCCASFAATGSSRAPLDTGLRRYDGRAGARGLCGAFDGWRRAMVLDPSASLGMTSCKMSGRDRRGRFAVGGSRRELPDWC